MHRNLTLIEKKGVVKTTLNPLIIWRVLAPVTIINNNNIFKREREVLKAEVMSREEMMNVVWFVLIKNVQLRNIQKTP